jgi:excisionase family DNA binding protein
MKRYTTGEIAEIAGVHERTVKDWIAAGELRAVNLSRKRNSKKPRLRVLESDWQAFLASRSTGRIENPAPRRKRDLAVKEFFK